MCVCVYVCVCMLEEGVVCMCVCARMSGVADTSSKNTTIRNTCKKQKSVITEWEARWASAHEKARSVPLVSSSCFHHTSISCLSVCVSLGLPPPPLPPLLSLLRTHVRSLSLSPLTPLSPAFAPTLPPSLPLSLLLYARCSLSLSHSS